MPQSHAMPFGMMSSADVHVQNVCDLLDLAFMNLECLLKEVPLCADQALMVHEFCHDQNQNQNQNHVCSWISTV